MFNIFRRFRQARVWLAVYGINRNENFNHTEAMKMADEAVAHTP